MRLALLAVACAALAATPAWAQPGGTPATSPIGLWRTISDRTGRETGTVQIFAADGVLYGRVTAIADPAERAALCQHCDGDRRGVPVLGMQVIRGLHPDGDGWDGGTILDPRTGDVYRCTMHLEDGGRRLIVRGFLGISLFGRSQTWLRAD